MGHDLLGPQGATVEIGLHFNMDTGLAETVRWYLDHLDWCAAVQQKAAYERERLGRG